MPNKNAPALTQALKAKGKSIRKSTQTHKRRGRLKEMAYALKRTPEDSVATQVVGMG